MRAEDGEIKKGEDTCKDGKGGKGTERCRDSETLYKKTSPPKPMGLETRCLAEKVEHASSFLGMSAA